jgi:hypothetical protein
MKDFYEKRVAWDTLMKVGSVYVSYFFLRLVFALSSLGLPRLVFFLVLFFLICHVFVLCCLGIVDGSSCPICLLPTFLVPLESG